MTDDDRTQAMARAYVERGLSYAQIGEEYGLTKQRVGQILAPLGLGQNRVRVSKVVREQNLRAAYEKIAAGELTLEEAALQLGYKNGHVLRNALYDIDLRVHVLNYEEPEHGTYARYRSRRYRCRCVECRQANAARSRARSRARSGLEPPQHGTPSAYKNYGCHCQICKEANRLHVRSKKAAKRQRGREEVKA